MKTRITFSVLFAIAASPLDSFSLFLTPVGAFTGIWCCRKMAGKLPTESLSSSLSHSQPASFCDLPGDPSLILTTNVNLGEQKLGVMKLCSKAIAEHTGKPESYVGKFVPFWWHFSPQRA
jgi:hypothetical protein